MELTSQTIGLALGWLGLGWVALEALLLSVRTLQSRFRARRRLADERAEFCRRVQAAAVAARAEQALPDWEGWRLLRVAAIVDEAHDTKSFYFAATDERPLARFSPGQYLTFRLPIAGPSPVVRCYTLSDRPREDFYRCTIKRISQPSDRPNVPPGRGSNHFHDRVKVGDLVEARAPAGTFFIDALDTTPVVLIGAGIGVTPLLSMLESVVHSRRSLDVYALFGFRNGREHPFKDRLARLAVSQANVQIHVSYSTPRKEDVLYRDFNHVGRMTFERVRAILPSNNRRFYVCGPAQMMETLVPALWDWGVPESHVHFEAFGSASIKRVNANSTAAAQAPCEVRFDRTGRSLTWDGKLTSLLELGEAGGIRLASGCRAGSCGECLVAVKSGKFKQLKPSGVAVPAGHCLACLTIPNGELVLDA